MDAQILTTRIEVPPSRAHQVQRTRLLARLNAALLPGEAELTHLVLVSAPAGFGKTTLLANWVRQSGQPAAWFSSEEGDHDIVRFLRYLLAALQRIHPTLGEGLQETLTTASFSGQDAPALIEQTLTVLINQIHASQQRFILVLDDYHLIRQELIHRAVIFLLQHLPSAMLLVIASRSDPPLPLARLRARGQLIELRQADLRFSEEESAAFLRLLTGLQLAQDEAQALEARTEGWAAGLQMAGLAIQGELADQNNSGRSGRLDLTEFLKAFRGSNRFVLDYLVEEVFQDQPKEIRAFLLKTSILERMTAGLCAAIMEGDTETAYDAAVLSNAETESNQASSLSRQRAARYQSLLDHLDRSNLFILPLDSQHNWYRYHTLFADLLRNRLEATFPEQVTVLHERASLWYEHNQQPREAIQHALKGGNFARAAALIEAAGITALHQGELATLNAWVEALPVEVVQSQPGLDVLWLWARFFSSAPANSIQAQIQRLLEAPPEIAARAQVLRAFLEMYQGRMETAGETLAQAVPALSAGDSYFHGVANWLKGLIILNTGSLEAAFPILEEAAAQAQKTGNVMAVVLALSQLGVQLSRRGQLDQARETLKRAIDLASDRQGNIFPVASMALAYLAELHREWGEIEEARRCLEQAITLSQGWRAAAALTAYVVLARLHAMQGQYDQADQMIQIALRLAGETQETRMDDYSVSAERARLWALAGRYDRVAAWAQQITTQPQKPLSAEERFVHSRLQKYYSLVLARLATASGRPEEALRELDALLPRIEAQGRTSMIIEILVLQALARDAQAAHPQAMLTIERATRLAFHGKYYRLLLDEGPRLIALLARLRAELAGLPAPDPDLLAYLDRLLTGQSTPPERAVRGQPKPAGTLVEPLSDRELEVLRLLDAGLSTGVIAENLTVSPHTVRSHFKNIFAKLDAHSRYEALSRAREMGIL